MKKIIATIATLLALSMAFVGCNKEGGDDTTGGSQPSTPAAPADKGIELEKEIESWAGSIASDGVVTYANNYGEVALKLSSGDVKTGDKVVIKFAEVPSKVQFHWVETGYTTHQESWGEAIDNEFQHYSGNITSDTYEYTFEKDVHSMGVQANNDATATCKIVSAKLYKAE